MNVHFSLLPKYRGAAPVNWAIVNGEKQTGVTTMRIVEELDAGPILLSRATEIGNGETAPQLMKRLADIGADLLAETLKSLPTLAEHPQQHDEATFAPVLKRKDGSIEWAMDAFAIERRVRGLQSWPNAYTSQHEKRLIIWLAIAENSNNGPDQAGQVLEARADRLVIGCGEGTALRILEVQPEGGRRMSTRAFLNGTHIKVGDRLGSV